MLCLGEPFFPCGLITSPKKVQVTSLSPPERGLGEPGLQTFAIRGHVEASCSRTAQAHGQTSRPPRSHLGPAAWLPRTG